MYPEHIYIFDIRIRRGGREHVWAVADTTTIHSLDRDESNQRLHAADSVPCHKHMTNKHI